MRTRTLHKYIGVITSIGLLIMTVTGVLLLNLNRVESSFTEITTAKKLEDKWLVGTDKGVYWGTSLSLENLIPVKGIYTNEPVVSIQVSATSEVCVGFKFGSIYCSIDNGRIWRNRSLSLEAHNLTDLMYDDNVLLAFTSKGVYQINETNFTQLSVNKNWSGIRHTLLAWHVAYFSTPLQWLYTLSAIGLLVLIYSGLRLFFK